MKLMALNLVDIDERASAKSEQERKRIQKKYNLGNDSFSFRNVYNKIPTNARLLVENILGRKSDITEKDFTEDELIEMILLSEKQENNYRNKKNRKFANQPLNQTTVSSYGNDPQALGANKVDESYAGSLYRTFTDPQYRVATSLGRFDSESSPDDITIRDEYNFNKKQRDLPTDLKSMLSLIGNSPEVAGEYLANLFNTPTRKVNIKVPKNYSEGGQVMRDQMEMAFNQQAPQVDPVSGNEVPPGSLPEEVRDDIDAKLSEGEYVVPADVVRFFGVKYFEDLRTEAKMGLAGMEADGRIGGEPVDMAAMPPQGMNISEEDIAALEQALTTGAYEGGLMDKMAIAAKNDPMVNSRMNAKGMAVGFAEGGLTESLYNDPTRMDSIIEKVMVAAKANPALMEELSKRGVAVNTTQANMNPADIKQANTDTASEKLLEEKSTGFAAGGFNPASYGLGFSTFGSNAPGMGGAETTMVAYYNPTTGETKSFAHNTSTNVPVSPIPAGFIMGSAPAVVTNAGMGTGGGGAVDRFGGAAIGESYTKPNGETATRMPDSFYASGGDQEQNRFMQNMMENKDTDKNSWKSEFKYDDPKVLYEQTKAKLTKKPGFLGSMLSAVAPGRLYNAGQLANLQSNIEYLKKREGATEEELTTLQDLWDEKTKQQLGSLGGGPWSGFILDQTSTDSLLEEFGKSSFKRSINPNAIDAGASTAKTMTPKQVKAGIDYAATGDARAKTFDGGRVVENQATPRSSDRDQSKNAAEQAQDARSASKKAAKKLGVKLATGGRAKGGLMKKTNKK